MAPATMRAGYSEGSNTRLRHYCHSHTMRRQKWPSGAVRLWRSGHRRRRIVGREDVVLVSRGIRDVQPSDVGGRRGGAAPWGFWSAGGGTAGTGKVNPALLPEGGQVACHRAGCRYRPQTLADDQGTLDRRVSAVP